MHKIDCEPNTAKYPPWPTVFNRAFHAPRLAQTGPAAACFTYEDVRTYSRRKYFRPLMCFLFF